MKIIFNLLTIITNVKQLILMVKIAETRQKILRAILRDKIMLTYSVVANCNSFSLNTLMQQAHHLNNSANQLTII